MISSPLANLEALCKATGRIEGIVTRRQDAEGVHPGRVGHSEDEPLDVHRVHGEGCAWAQRLLEQWFNDSKVMPCKKSRYRYLRLLSALGAYRRLPQLPHAHEGTVQLRVQES